MFVDWTFIFAILFFIWLVIFLGVNAGRRDKGIKWGLYECIYCIVGAILLATAVLPITTLKRTEDTEVNISFVELLSMSNGMEIEGEGHLSRLSGQFVINTYDTYRYYYESELGYIDQGRSPVDASHILYTDESPYLEITTTKYIRTNKWLFLTERITDTSVVYVYHVPEGSVVTEYELH